MKHSKKEHKNDCYFPILFIYFITFLVFFFILVNQGTAESRPSTVSDVALYMGSDRENFLIEGAKKEGKLTFYNSHTWLATVAQEFEKVYPFVKVSVWRSETKKILKRVIEEYHAKRFYADVIETPYPVIRLFQREGLLQEYYTPEACFYEDNVMVKAETGVFYLGDREVYIGLAFNTDLISSSEAPKTYKDLLSAQWKRRISISGTTTGTWWIGNIVDTMGMEFIEKLKRQDVRLHVLSGAALANLIVAGEVPLSPTIYNSNIIVAKQKGANVEWRPLEPAIAVVGYSGLVTKAPHPYSSMLFLDYIHSKKGQEVIMKGGLCSPRKDIGSLDQKFEKTYQEARYPVFVEYQKQFNQWERITKSFIKIRH